MTENHSTTDMSSDEPAEYNDATTEMASSEPTERARITISVPLDPAHQRMDLTLREHLEGEPADLEDLVAQQVAPQVEQALYGILQSVKYDE
jgi:hypothetical protein